jgi:hypothetical protein
VVHDQFDGREKMVKQKEPQRMELVRVESVPSIYSNNAEITASNWDFKFKFGEIEGVSEGKIAVAERVRVVMSPQHAKVFCDVLAKHIARYEKQFGEINAGTNAVPPDETETTTE